MKRVQRVILILCVLGTGWCAMAAATNDAAPVAVPAGAVDILTGESYWRWFLMLRKPLIPVAALKAAGQDAAQPLLLSGTVVPPPYNQVDHQESPPPPSGWDQPAFDDFAWPRSRVSWVGPSAFSRFSSATLCLRGRFVVTDPAAVQGLYLTLKYYGGVRVLVNGREIARQFLPAGTLAPETPAETYPKGAYLDDKDVIVPFGDSEYGWSRIQGEQKKDGLERRASRTRVLGPLPIPADALRKGENLITVELRRTEYPYESLRWFKKAEGGTKPFWIPMNLFELRLQAAGGGVTPNVARPKGAQIWSENTNDRVCVLDYGDTGEGVRPVRIVGARNGFFTGQFVVGSDQPLKGVQVTAGDLKAVTGGGTIPAGAVTFLYGLPDVSFYGTPTWYDALVPTPPAEVPLAKGGTGALLPVLLRVAIPKDAPAGNYRGEVAVTLGGDAAARLVMPVELHVADWVVPDPKKYRSYVGVYQSPTSLALKYNVKEWSEEHWKLMEKSFALLARAGNRLVNITVVDQTQFGNEDGMITWVRQPDGTFTYDFGVFDRYLDLAQKQFGPLDFVAMHVWHSGGWETRKADQENTVTVLDAKTGQREHLQVPVFGTEESKKFWKPLLDAAQERLAKRGLEKAMILGILSDGTAPPEVFKAFNEIMPGGAKWMRGCHSGTYSEKPDPLPGGGVTVLHEFCYGTPIDKAKPLASYWKQRQWPGADYERMGNHDSFVGLSWYRETGMTALMRRTRGVGRICLDFFDVLGKNSASSGGVGSVLTIYNRWPRSTCAQREPSLKKMIWAAPDGPATTFRYEAFCEGMQYAEALVTVSEAIDTKAAELGDARLQADRQLLTDMWCREVRCGVGPALRPNHEGWQDQARRLFAAAAEADKPATGK
jgi:hypothetical protein